MHVQMDSSTQMIPTYVEVRLTIRNATIYLLKFVNHTLSTVPPYLLFSYYTRSYNYIQRSRLDGSERVTVYRGGRPHALAFDYK